MRLFMHAHMLMMSLADPLFHDMGVIDLRVHKANEVTKGGRRRFKDVLDHSTNDVHTHGCFEDAVAYLRSHPGLSRHTVVIGNRSSTHNRTWAESE